MTATGGRTNSTRQATKEGYFIPKLLNKLLVARSMSTSNPPALKRPKTDITISRRWTPLKGIICPIVTPLLEQDVIDKIGTKQLIDHLVIGGVTGVFLLGSTGEGPSLSFAAKRQFVEYACEVVAGRVPVLVSISDTSFSETLAMARFVANLQAESCHDASYSVVFTPPFYFTMGQEELLRYAQKVVKEIPDHLSILLYNIPFLTKTHWSVDVVCKVLAWDEQHNHSQIVGMKDSSGDLIYFKQLCQDTKKKRKDFSLYMGPEHLLREAIDLGADGGVNGGSNVVPELFVKTYRAVTSRHCDMDEVRTLLAGIDALQGIYTVTGTSKTHPFSRLIAGTKYALKGRRVLGTVFVNQPFTVGVCEEEARILNEIESILLTVSQLQNTPRGTS